jgi:hypothetical protein
MTGGQRGSVLVAVMGISLILTAAAAGYLAIGASAGGANAANYRLTQTRLAAESGLVLGIRWFKQYPFGSVTNPLWATNMVLTPGTQGWMPVDGIQVKVVEQNLGGGSQRLVTSSATAGPGMDTVLLTLKITGANQIVGANPGDPQTNYTGDLNTWTETLIPGK